jgi:hypothetical protein
MNMSRNLDRVPRRRGIRSALVAGGALFAVSVLQSLLGAVISLPTFGIGAQTAGDVIGGLVQQTCTIYLPFTIGVVASLWLIAPLASGLTLLRVVLRAAVASAIGAVFVAVVLIGSRLDSLPGVGGLMSQIRFTGLSAEATLNLFGIALDNAAREFISATPLVAVVAIFAWSRLPKRQSTQVLFGRARQV